MKAFIFSLTIAVALSCNVIIANADSPYINIGNIEKRELANKVNQLNQGDTVEQVLKLLGTPYSDNLMMRKEDNEVIGRSLKYYAVKLDKDSVNEKHDQLVLIHLGPDDKIYQIHVNLKLE